MKLGEGGDAFFVFETNEDVPEALQTSPLISPAGSPTALGDPHGLPETLQEPEYLDISSNARRRPRPTSAIFASEELSLSAPHRANSDLGNITPLSSSPIQLQSKPPEWLDPAETRLGLDRTTSAELPTRRRANTFDGRDGEQGHAAPRDYAPSSSGSDGRSRSPPPLSSIEALNRAKALSRKLKSSNIPSQIMESGDLMLDMQGYKSNEEDALRAEVIARQLLAEELQGDYDVGAIMGADDAGNLWIYSSEEAKEAAKRRKHSFAGSNSELTSDAASDPGAIIEEKRIEAGLDRSMPNRPPVGMVTPPQTPPGQGIAGDPNKNYVKTLRLTSDQIKSMKLKQGANKMTFTVAKATCTAWLFYWSSKVPLVVSDIDGTITKSDALGHVLNYIGRDWTHAGVAKLYTDIVANGYNIFYLSSRSVGQADMTRAYLNGVVQDGYKLPHGPVILSPDRTLAALRREVYLRKPEIFKMQCLRDIHSLYAPDSLHPFYAGFGNRLTDAISYRTVDIPSNRIFTINSNAEVSLDLVNFSKYKASYTSIREVVDHYFPPVSTLVDGGGDDYTDFQFWRERTYDVIDFSASEDEDDGDGPPRPRGRGSLQSEDQRTIDDDDDVDDDDAGASYLSDEIEDMEASMVGSIDEMYMSPRQSIEEAAADDIYSAADEEDDYIEHRERTPRVRERGGR